MGQAEDKASVKKSKSVIGKNNRRKGHNFEREIAKVLREIGYDKAATSRACNRLLDDLGIDIAPNGVLTTGMSLLIQCKHGYLRSRPKADVIFNQMDQAIAKYFPPEHDIWEATKILMHRFGPKPEETLVTITLEDWVKIQKRLITLENRNGEVESEKQNEDN